MSSWSKAIALASLQHAATGSWVFDFITSLWPAAVNLHDGEEDIDLYNNDDDNDDDEKKKRSSY